MESTMENTMENNTALTGMWLPTVRYGLTVAFNRAAIATGSPQRAMQGEYADYNGHTVRVWWNFYFRHWTASYRWSGERRLATGTLQQALEAGINFYRKGSLGNQLILDFDAKADISVEEQRLIAEGYGLLPYNAQIHAADNAEWQDERFAEIGSVLREEKMGSGWKTAILLSSTDIADYRKRVQQHLEARRRAAQCALEASRG